MNSFEYFSYPEQDKWFKVSFCVVGKKENVHNKSNIKGIVAPLLKSYRSMCSFPCHWSNIGLGQKGETKKHQVQSNVGVISLAEQVSLHLWLLSARHLINKECFFVRFIGWEMDVPGALWWRLRVRSAMACHLRLHLPNRGAQCATCWLLPVGPWDTRFRNLLCTFMLNAGLSNLRPRCVHSPS